MTKKSCNNDDREAKYEIVTKEIGFLGSRVIKVEYLCRDCYRGKKP